jgi:hypothetical protein
MRALEFGGHHVVVEEVDKLSDLKDGDMYLYAHENDQIIAFEQAKFFKIKAKQDVKILKVVWSYINYTKPYDKFYRHIEKAKVMGDMIMLRHAEIF